jgi:hypothetical protein
MSVRTVVVDGQLVENVMAGPIDPIEEPTFKL